MILFRIVVAELCEQVLIHLWLLILWTGMCWLLKRLCCELLIWLCSLFGWLNSRTKPLGFVVVCKFNLLNLCARRIILRIILRCYHHNTSQQRLCCNACRSLLYNLSAIYFCRPIDGQIFVAVDLSLVGYGPVHVLLKMWTLALVQVFNLWSRCCWC